MLTPRDLLTIKNNQAISRKAYKNAPRVSADALLDSAIGMDDLAMAATEQKLINAESVTPQRPFSISDAPVPDRVKPQTFIQTPALQGDYIPLNKNYYGGIEARRLQPGDTIGVYKEYFTPDGQDPTPSAYKLARVTGNYTKTFDPESQTFIPNLPVEYLGRKQQFDTLPTYQQSQAMSRIRPNRDVQWERTEGQGLFYNDNAMAWETNPIHKKVDYMLKADIDRPTQPPEVLAGINRIDLGNGLQKVTWTNRRPEEGGPYPRVFTQDKKSLPLAEAAPDQYPFFMANASSPRFWKDSNGAYQQTPGTKLTQSSENLPRRRDMSTTAQTLYSVNNLQQEALASRLTPVTEVYRGSPLEPGYDAIQDLASRGGSGKWTNLANDVTDFEDNYNTFYAGTSSRADQMVADDLVRGGQLKRMAGGGTKITPAVDVEDFSYDKLKYDPRGFIVDNRTDTSVGQGQRSLPPASFFLDSAPQYATVANPEKRNLLRFDTPETTPLTLNQVNEYGLVTSPYDFPQDYEGRRQAISVLRNNNQIPLNPQSYTVTNKAGKEITRADRLAGQQPMAYGGKWMGGGLKSNFDTAQSNSDPLIFGQKGDRLNTPQGTQYRRVLDSNDPRVVELQNQQAAFQDEYASTLAAQQQDLADYPPFTRQYTITPTGRESVPELPTQAIEGAYLPITKEYADGKIGHEYMPYVPQQSLLDTHLADVAVELDGAKYRLTPEATTTPYLLSESQRSADTVLRHGKVKVDVDGNASYLEPTDEWLAQQTRGRAQSFDADDDFALFATNSDNAEIYHDPTIAPNDIRSALDSKKQELARLKAGVSNLEGSNYNGMWFPPSPTATQDSRISIIQDGQRQPLLDSAVGNSTLSRFMTEDEAKRIALDNMQRPKTRVVKDEDGTTWVEEIDNISQRDLTNIFNSDPDRRLTAQELKTRADSLQSSINQAESAVRQLQGLEPSPEVTITANTSNRKARTLAEQAESLGIPYQSPDKGQFQTTTDLPIDSLSLPVRYNASRQDLDPELVAMASRANEQDLRDTEAAQRLIDFNIAYKQQLRNEQLGTPSVVQVLGEKELAAKQDAIANRAGKAARLDRLADVQADAFANLLTQGENVQEMAGTNNILGESGKLYPGGRTTSGNWNRAKQPSKYRKLEGSLVNLDAAQPITYDMEPGRIPLKPRTTADYDELIRLGNQQSTSPIAVAPTQEPSFIDANTLPQDLSNLPVVGDVNDNRVMKPLNIQYVDGKLVYVDQAPTPTPTPAPTSQSAPQSFYDDELPYNPFAGDDGMIIGEEYYPPQYPGEAVIPQVPVTNSGVGVDSAGNSYRDWDSIKQTLANTPNLGQWQQFLRGDNKEYVLPALGLNDEAASQYRYLAQDGKEDRAALAAYLIDNGYSLNEVAPRVQKYLADTDPDSGMTQPPVINSRGEIVLANPQPQRQRESIYEYGVTPQANYEPQVNRQRRTNQTPQVVNATLQTPYDEPQYVSYEDLYPQATATSQQVSNPQQPDMRERLKQLPNWAVPAALGGTVLGATALNNYVKGEEKKRREDEMRYRQIMGYPMY